ncbi:hypothetical protein IT084_08115 [Desulfallas sp. Bu1-1]|jgi:type II secretory pathway component PulK|uniref:hypothetical protein n=1 Tax=Desulfallas sp. Bu1-1 TaxID=2787620 RepID=UPI0018A126A5|nr:hypothetical protein [Desulfallas sp. Bu1-1]MBF7082938.1 hypothetical protein [Desulfallas sp. Bu1-1]
MNISEAVIIALLVFALGAVISFMVAALIKGIFVCIRLRETVKIKSKEKWQGVTAASKS